MQAASHFKIMLDAISQNAWDTGERPAVLSIQKCLADMTYVVMFGICTIPIEQQHLYEWLYIGFLVHVLTFPTCAHCTHSRCWFGPISDICHIHEETQGAVKLGTVTPFFNNVVRSIPFSCDICLKIVTLLNSPKIELSTKATPHRTCVSPPSLPSPSSSLLQPPVWNTGVLHGVFSRD